MTKIASTIVGCATLLWSTTVMATLAPPATSLNTCQNAVKAAMASFVANKVTAIGGCLQAVSTQVVKNNAVDAHAAAGVCVAQFRRLNDSRGLNKQLSDKLKVTVTKKCAPGQPGVTHTLGDLLGSGAGVSQALDADALNAWCSHYGGDGSIDSLQWIDCLTAAAECAVDSIIASQYPRALEWLNLVKPSMQALSPPVADPAKISDAVASLDAVKAAIDGPDNDNIVSIQCGGSQVSPPTATPSNTPTNTPSNTPTNTPSNTPTNTPSNTPTLTPNPTNTPTTTPSETSAITPPATPGCSLPSDCPPTGSECSTATCAAGQCGISFVSAGTATSSQTPGDCMQNQCDGAGGTTSVVDNADVPADDGNQCTNEVCTVGVPSHPVAAARTVCNQNGGTLCDDAGVCTNSVQIVRVGDGSAALSTAATAVFLEERFVSNGALVPTGHNPLALPTTVNGGNARLTLTGSGTSEGALALSADGHYVTLAGYDAASGTASVSSSTSATVNRIAGRVDASGAIDTSTRINALISTNSPRSAVTDDGTRFWVSGSTNGVVYIPFGTTGGTSILATPASVRVVDIFAGQLFGTAQSGTFTNVFTIGTGLPTTSGTTATSLPGMPTTAGPSPYGYAFVGSNVLYVADDRTIASGGGVQKWTLAGSTWSLATTFKSGISAGTRGVAAVVTGSTTTVLATVAAASANAVVTFIDDGLNLNPSATVIATAPTNTVYRGVALSPD